MALAFSMQAEISTTKTSANWWQRSLVFIEKVVIFIKQPYLATISFHHALF